MSERLVVTRRSVTFHIGDSPQPGSVDVVIDGHRVWSTTPPLADAAGRISMRWPAAIVPYLRGRARFEIHDSATGAVLADATVQLTRSTKPLEVKNGQGRWLAVNKWKRMGASIEGDDSGMRQRLLERSKVLIDQLGELGYTAYITGGTLLGAVRRADLLPHDDDTDLGILLEHSHPSDLSLDSYRLEDQLNELGYTIVRHSTSHLQLMFLEDDGRIDHYIDIFSGFYRADDEFCQPFHVRTNVPRASMVPLIEMPIAGQQFPAPHVPADWLAACYGESWETPDPSFHFDTPLTTRRRFENWFGSQNMNRVYWEGVYARTEVSELVSGDAQHTRALSRVLPAGAPVIDLGCGTGAVTRVISGHGHDTIGLDYSHRALAIGRAVHPDQAQPEWRYGNLYDRRRLLQLGAELVRDGRSWHVSLNHVLEGLTEEGRGNVFLLLRLILQPDARAVATVDTNFITRHYRGDDPQSWHLPLEWLQAETARAGLEVEVVNKGRRRTPIGWRTTLTVTLRRHGEGG